MKQWIFTAALSISLVCGHLEAAGGEYSIRKEQAGQEQAVQTQEVQGRAVQCFRIRPPTSGGHSEMFCIQQACRRLR